MNSYDFFIYEFICFMNSYMNSGVPRFQMARVELELPMLIANNSVPKPNLERSILFYRQNVIFDW